MKKALAALLLIALSFAMLILITARTIVGTAFAVAHSSEWFGPGVNVFFSGVSPTPGGSLDLEIAVHGGSAAGIQKIVSTIDDAAPVINIGNGVTWGSSISTKNIGEDAAFISLPLPESFTAGSAHTATLDVDYSLAMSSSGSFFSNQSKHEQLKFSFEVVSSAVQWGARALLLLQGLVVFGVACGVTIFFTVRFKDKPSTDDELFAYFLIEVLMASGFVAYWLFSWPIQRALGLSNVWFSVLLVLGWFVSLFWLMLSFRKSRPTPTRYTLRLEVQQEPSDGDPYRSQKTSARAWVSLLDLLRLCKREGLRTRLWFWSLSVWVSGCKLKLKIDENHDLIVYSLYEAPAKKLAQIIAAQVGKVHLDDGKTSTLISKRD